MSLILLYIFAALFVAVLADYARPYAPLLAPSYACPACGARRWRIAQWG